LPLWFGNQDNLDDENPVYGTSKVLMAYRDLDLLETEEAIRGLNSLEMLQNKDGGWGGGVSLHRGLGASRLDSSESRSLLDQFGTSSVEESALALEILLAAPTEAGLRPSAKKGLGWLVKIVETDFHCVPSPIGFYFAKLWYHEQLYPLIFTTSAIGYAVTQLRDELTTPANQPTP